MIIAEKSQEVVDILHEIADANNGILLPEHVVEAARPKSSPLHNRFDWDDNEAAEKWRLHQARKLIRVVVEYIPADKSASDPTPVFVALRTESSTGGGYRKMVDVLSDDQQRDILISQALADMETFRRKYRHLKELAAIFTAMESVKARVS